MQPSSTLTGILLDAFDRVQSEVEAVLDGVAAPTLTWRADGEANTVAWLVWHLTRVEDDHVAALAHRPQAWHETWAERFALPLGPDDTGYGHTAADVAAVVASADLLRGYQADVHARTVRWVGEADDDALAAVVDRSWDPPVTAAVRLVSVLSDCLQHCGQAALVRGLAERA